MIRTAAFIILFSQVLGASTGSAQTPVVLKHLNGWSPHASSSAMMMAPGPRSAWAGAQVAYNFAGNGVLADNLNVAAQGALQYWTPPGKFLLLGGSFQVPFIGNIARPDPSATSDHIDQKLQELATSSAGIHFGFAPNVLWPLGDEGYAIHAWSYVGVRRTAVEDTLGENRNLDQFRTTLGFEFMFACFTVGDAPGSLSVELIRLAFDEEQYASVFSDTRRSRLHTEIMLVIPLGNQFGVLAQYTVDHSGGTNPYGLGLVFNPPAPGAPGRAEQR